MYNQGKTNNQIEYSSEVAGMINFVLLFTGFGTKQDRTSANAINFYTFMLFTNQKTKNKVGVSLSQRWISFYFVHVASNGLVIHQF